MPLLETKGALSAQGYGLTTSRPSEAAYIEDVFSTWLYTGNGSTQTISNGIDLAGKGGLVWVKRRDTDDNHRLVDTARGVNWALQSNTTSGQDNSFQSVTAFNSNGFTVGSGSAVNASGSTYASWTFREQPRFFDVVTYTGNGANRTIAHSLGSVPGCIMVKRLDTTGDWQVYHRSLANTQYMVLNSTAAAATGATRWNSTTPTATEFSLGTNATVNANGGTYVAYLFAHNAGGFGASGADNVISCGSYTGTGASPGPTIDLGWEPQFILYKRASGGTGDWGIHDNMRGLGVGTSSTSGSGNILEPNTLDAETGTSNFANISATGFTITPTVADINALGSTYIYIAIRRGPMRTPTTGTSVFQGLTYAGNNSTTTGQNVDTAFPMDFAFTRYNRSNLGDWDAISRLQGLSTAPSSSRYLNPHNTNAEATGGYLWQVSQLQLKIYGFPASTTQLNYLFRRAPGFFDVVCYTGNGTNRTVSHNLGVVPELMIVKGRSGATAWQVYSSALANTEYLVLNTTAAKATGATRWNSTTPTSSVFSLGTASDVNTNAATYVAYLFASAPGVSKVGSYTGTGATQVIDCGFAAGARFVLIKQTDSTGDWYVWDSARGIVAGNDPYLLLNSTAAEVTTTDWVDTAASGFELSNAAGNLVNTNGASYIFLSVA